MCIEIKNRNLFMSLLSIFKSKEKIQMTIDKDTILIECIGIHKYYLSIPSTIFSTKKKCDKFTINPKHLHSALSLLSSDNFEVNNEYIKIFTDISYIKIPLLSTIEHQYEEIEDVYTRFVVNSSVVGIFANMSGLVKYEIENEKLYLRKNVIEEIEIKNLNFIETGELSFVCNNEWAEVSQNIMSHVDKVLFLYSAHFLSVQYLFKNDEKIYLEIQVPKSTVDF